jgi:hypothetical protein
VFFASKLGYIFQNGDKGLGYYKDNKPMVEKSEIAEVLQWAMDDTD